eukprot:3330464-Pyramimonas_sp.AAC.1
MEFVMHAVVFEAKPEGLWIAELATTGVVLGQGRGHGINASLSDSLFQALVRAGLCRESLGREEGGRVACAAFLEHLRNAGDSWLD